MKAAQLVDAIRRPARAGLLTVGVALIAASASAQSITVQPFPGTGAALISGVGFPPNCEYATLSAILQGVITDRITLGALFTNPDGSWAFGFNFPDEALTATHYLWEGGGSCAGVVLRGASPGGPFPITVALTPFDLSSVPPVMTIQNPQAFTTQVVRGSGLRPNDQFVLALGGVIISAGQTGPDGSFAGRFDVTAAPPGLPRSVAVLFDALTTTFEGTEVDGPYPKTIALSPYGTLILEQPQDGATAVILGAGFPPNCETSVLSAFQGVVTHRVFLGAFNTPANGSWAFNFNFPGEAASATDYLWEGGGSCAGLVLRGTNPGGGYPRNVSFAPFDLASVAPVMTIESPVAFTNQIVRGDGLPPDSQFLLLRAGRPTNVGQTQSDGSFAGNFDATGLPPAFPRSVTLQFDTQTFQGTELEGTYPKTIALSPYGTLVLEQPQDGASAVISGAGFPPNCESSVLFAVSGGTQVGLGGFNTPANGYWSFNFNYPAAADSATGFVWEGHGSCAGIVLRGANPFGPYPRDVHLTRTTVHVVPVDIKPGSCPNPLNLGSHGVLPVAVLGTPDLDVRRIDPASLRLMGLAPIRSSLEDVGSPLGREPQDPSDCTVAGADGFMDLVLKFDSQQLATAIGPAPDGFPWALILTGTLKPEFGGGPIMGRDIVVIQAKK